MPVNLLSAGNSVVALENFELVTADEVLERLYCVSLDPER